MNREISAPIVALTLVCLLMSGALAAGRALTGPIIEKADAERTEAAVMDVIPGAEGFSPITAEGLPATVTTVYGTANKAGYAFIVKTPGYGGDISIICGIDPDGRITKCATLSHSETKGLGTKVIDGERAYAGKDKSLAGIDAVSGATITSNAYKNGVLDAFKAFEIIKGAGL